MPAEAGAQSADDIFWMQRALEQAYAAHAIDEIPVGAVLVRDGVLIAEAHNRTRIDDDPTAHAELVLLRRAATRIGGRATAMAEARLLDTTMYVTLEPCAMCAGALVLAKVTRLVFAAADPKTGMCGSLANLVQDSRLNHRLEVTGGVLADPAANLLRGFFRARRAADRG
ncbi:MAG: tRNA adenosine(34) deaminase TadA [Longimicrobiales bacterium]